MEKIFVTKAFLPPFEEFVDKIKPLWDSAKITNMGGNYRQLEEELIKFLKIQNISLFTNGHMALELLLQAYGLEGEVITTPYTFASTTHAIVRNGLQPVFCDIKETDYTIDENQIEKLITDKTVAILPVHVYGHPCNDKVLKKIAKKYNLKLIYDAAHAFGVEESGESVVGYGDASILSFHATKVFNTIEGGAAIFKDALLKEKLHGLKNFGIRNELVVDAIGANAKLDEFRAVMGLCNLKYMNEAIEQRKLVYNRYLYNLKGLEGVKLSYVPENEKYNYAYFPVFIDAEEYVEGIRDKIYDYLKEYGIYSRRYFYPLITDMECYKNNYSSQKTPVAKKISEGILTLPIYPGLELDVVDRISGLLRNYLDKRGNV